MRGEKNIFEMMIHRQVLIYWHFFVKYRRTRRKRRKEEKRKV